MSGYTNRLAELLGNLQEEGAEVIKIGSKINRFSPSKEKLEHLGEEIGDFMAMVDFLVQEKHIHERDIEVGFNRKRKKMLEPDHMTHLK